MNDEVLDCADCGKQHGKLESFPGRRCLECWAKTPEANRPVSADEVASMWGIRRGRR
jgi:hypothetical protein